MLREKRMIDLLRRGAVEMPPLRLEALATRSGEDAALAVRWSGRTFRFSVTVKRLATPRMFSQALAQVRGALRPANAYPMLVVPFLPPDRIAQLERAGISGLDLSGNGIVTVPDEILVVRTGQPSRYPSSALIRNVYRRRASIVPRTFLIRPRFAALTAIRTLARERGSSIALGTVFKAVKQMEEDVVVGREAGAIRLLQPESLLERLGSNYEAPEIASRLRGATGLSEQAFTRRLLEVSMPAGGKAVQTGASSSRRYAVVAREPLVSFYCSGSLEAIARNLGKDFDPRSPFPNIELLETMDDRVYFDPREGRSSPVQCWLELQAGDKRDRETADPVKQRILKELNA